MGVLLGVFGDERVFDLNGHRMMFFPVQDFAMLRAYRVGMGVEIVSAGENPQCVDSEQGEGKHGLVPRASHGLYLS